MTHCCLTEFADVLEEHTASIFRVKESRKLILLNIREAVHSSEIPINFYQTTWHTSQKTVFFIDTAKKTSNLISLTSLNSMAFSPQANYTDRATAACRQS
jgi:hypothetical protein